MLTVEQKRRIAGMRRKGWTPEIIADFFDFDLESVKNYIYGRKTPPLKPNYPQYKPPDPDEEGLTELQRQERRSSAAAFTEMRARGELARSCKTERKARDDDPVNGFNPPLRSRNRHGDATSTNIGIPEKLRGWEFQDIQYHGDMWVHGEW